MPLAWHLLILIYDQTTVSIFLNLIGWHYYQQQSRIVFEIVWYKAHLMALGPHQYTPSTQSVQSCLLPQKQSALSLAILGSVSQITPPPQ